MKKALMGKMWCSLWLAFSAAVFFVEMVHAQRTLNEVAPTELARLGYRDKGELAGPYENCLALQVRTMKEEGCNSNDCVKDRPEWLSGNCDKHTAAMFFLTSLQPPRQPIGVILDENKKGDYLQSYAASCQQGYRAANPNGDIARAAATCMCAANQSLNLIDYNDFVAFENKTAGPDIMDGIKNRAAYARFICENRPDTGPGQSARNGASAVEGNGAQKILGAGGVDNARLSGLFEQLQQRGGALYNSLLVKLKAESQGNACGNGGACNRINEIFGAIYKDVLYTVYATEIYRSSGQGALSPARDKLNAFIKVILLSVEQNIKLVKNIGNETQGQDSGRVLLTRALDDAEECRKLLLAISRELEKR